MSSATNSILFVYYSACRGLEGIDPLLPAEIQRFSVNGNLHFNQVTFDEFK